MYYAISKNPIENKSFIEKVDVKTEAEAWHIASEILLKANDNRILTCCLTEKDMISIKEYINNNNL